MPIKILMPALSPTMTEGNFVKWHKGKGDTVSAGDILAEIETDKATMEVEAVDEGTLAALFVDDGTPEVKVNSLLAVLLEEDDDESALEAFLAQENGAAAPASTSQSISSQEGAQAPQNNTPTPPANIPGAPAVASATERIFASPLAKRLAQQQNIPLHTIQGSGPRGRIIKRDIESYQPVEMQHPAPQNTQVSSTPAPIDQGFSGFEPPFEKVSVSSMRGTIAKRLTASKQTIPHFYVSAQVQMDRLLGLRKVINEAPDTKISVNDFILKATATALHHMPEMNSAWAGDHVLRFQQVDLSVAVSLDEGLITPVIRDAHHKSLQTLSQEMKNLASRARDGKLKPAEFQGGTFSISNMGMFGVSEFSAIVNPPQSGILAVGAVEKRPYLKEDGTLVNQSWMTLTLSVDHRLIDGVLAARFLGKVKYFLEEPALMLL